VPGRRGTGHLLGAWVFMSVKALAEHSARTPPSLSIVTSPVDRGGNEAISAASAHALGLEPVIGRANLAEYLGVSERQFRRLCAKLPPPDFFVGVRAARWKVSTIRRWIDQGGPSASSRRRAGR
jgi:hypothetical protein